MVVDPPLLPLSPPSPIATVSSSEGLLSTRTCLKLPLRVPPPPPVLRCMLILDQVGQVAVLPLKLHFLSQSIFQLCFLSLQLHDSLGLLQIDLVLLLVSLPLCAKYLQHLILRLYHVSWNSRLLFIVPQSEGQESCEDVLVGK